ncbi:MAG: guanylate kinase [bacterium]
MSKLIIISGPSGVGKSTVVKYLLKRLKNSERTITFTTRSPRSKERNDVDYHFTDVKTFFKMKGDKQLAEWAKVYEHYYGTPKQQINNALKNNKNIIATVNVQGMKNLKKLYGQRAISIWINPEFPDKLAARLLRRTTVRKEETASRIRALRKEMEYGKLYDCQITNYEDNLPKTIASLLTILRKTARIA